MIEEFPKNGKCFLSGKRVENGLYARLMSPIRQLLQHGSSHIQGKAGNTLRGLITALFMQWKAWRQEALRYTMLVLIPHPVALIQRPQCIGNFLQSHNLIE